MGITGPTPTQPTKTHTHACMGMGWGGLGEGQLWVGYGYNPRWVWVQPMVGNPGLPMHHPIGRWEPSTVMLEDLKIGYIYNVLTSQIPEGPCLEIVFTHSEVLC